PEPIGQPSWGDRVQAAHQIREATRARQQVSDDQKGPALADYLQRSRPHAEVSVDALDFHIASPPLSKRSYRVDRLTQKYGLRAVVSSPRPPPRAQERGRLPR